MKTDRPRKPSPPGERSRSLRAQSLKKMQPLGVVQVLDVADQEGVHLHPPAELSGQAQPDDPRAGRRVVQLAVVTIDVGQDVPAVVSVEQIGAGERVHRG